MGIFSQLDFSVRQKPQTSAKDRSIRLDVNALSKKTPHSDDIAACRAELRRDPDNGAKWAELAEFFAKEKKWVKAAQAYTQVLTKAKISPSIQGRAAVVFCHAGQFREAHDLMAQAIKQNPNNQELQLDQFRVFRLSGQFNHACKVMAELKRNIAPRTLSEIYLATESYCKMSSGKYVQGLKFLKEIWDKGTEKTATGRYKRKYKFPAWDGGDLTGKTLLLKCEQGLGDGIIFLRYLPMLAAMNPDKIHVILARPLHRLLDGNPHVDLVADRKDYTSNADVQVFTFDLPLYFKTTPKTVPAPPTLNIPKSSVTRARKILKTHSSTFNVGVLWTGNPKFPENPQRSISVGRFLDLADIPNLQMFSLYKGDMPKILSSKPASEQILDVSNSDKDLADSAAFMEQLDLIITVDSAVAHLAGSLNTRVWCLLKFLPFWYYANGINTPWYPNMRLFKQKSPRKWDAVFADVRRELTHLAAQKNQ